MKNPLIISPSILRTLRVWVWIDIIIVCIISFLDIIGWIFDIPLLRTFRSTWIPMMPVTAICLLLCTAALISLAIYPIGKSLNIIPKLAGFTVSIVGLLTIISYSGVLISGKEISNTTIPFLGMFVSPGSRMALVTALNFLFIGLIIIMLTNHTRLMVNIAHSMLIVPLILSYLVLLSYILGVYHVHEIQAVPVSMNTGIAIFFLCSALLCLHADSWLMKTYMGGHAGSMMARRLLPGLILLPALIGWFRIYGESIGLFQSDVGVTLVAMTYTLCFICLVWLTAGSVNKTDVALRASQERFYTTLSSIGDAVIATDGEGKITFLNRVGEELTGWKFEEASGRPVKEVFYIINEQTRLEIESPVRMVLDKGMTVGIANHTVLVRKDKTEVPIDDSGAPIRSKEGIIEGVVLVFRDVSERKKAERLLRNSEQRLRFHFENSPLAVIEWDSNYIVTHWSIEAERLFGWTAEESIGKPIRSLNIIFEEDIPVVENTMKKLSGGENRTVVTSNRNITKQGEVIECTWFNSVLVDENGELESVMSLVLDITERKKMEEKIQYEAQRAHMLSDLSKFFSEAGFRVPDIFNTIAKSVAEYIGDICFITQMSRDGKLLLPAALYHPDAEARARYLSILPDVPILVGEGYAGQVALTGQSVMIPGISPEQVKENIKPEFWPYIDQLGLHDYLIVPLKTEGHVIGTLGVMRLRPGYSYTAEDQAFLEVIAGRAAMAITNSQFYEALQDSHAELEQKVLERTSELNKTMKVLSNEQKRFREVLDMLPSYVALLTPDYRFSFTNREFKRRFGEPDGKRCYEHLYDLKQPCENCRTIDVLKTDSCIFWEWKGPDGLTYDVSEFPFTDTDGSKLVLKIGSDITKVKEAEADRIARQVAESANLAKSEFLANISHEIRTPMNAIIGFSDLLYSTIKDEKQRSQVNAIQSSGKNLLILINDILDLSKIEAGKMKIQFEPVNFYKLISEIENVIIYRTQEKGIRFFIETEKDVPASLLLDETRLRQILSNLLDNAIKFTDHGHVILTIDRLLKNDEKIDLVLSIEDTGIGIPEDQQELIFHAFSRQKGLPEKKYGGTGLGLTITRRLVELMGGTINLSSKPGKGSIFTVILPDIPIVHEVGTGHREKIFDMRTIQFEKSTILIADDNFENRKLLIDLLGSSPLELIEAANGREALEMTEKYHPDLILMDLRMPEMSGYEATRILKSQESTKAVPIIALSASPKIVFNGKSNKDIFDDFIMKPVIIADIVEHLKKYLPYKLKEIDTADEQELIRQTDQKLTKKQRDQVRSLITTLESEYLPVYREAFAKQVISQIDLFGQNLISLGEKSGSGLLADYGRAICANAENFDVELLLEKLNLFPEIIDRLKKTMEA